MSISSQSKAYLAFLLVFVVSIIDLFAELGFAIGVLHLLGVSFAIWSRRKHLVQLVSGLAILSILGVYFIHTYQGEFDAEAIGNRLISIFIVAFTAVVLEIQNRSISERILAHKKLEGDIEKMVDQITDYSILLLDKEGKIRNWNNGSSRITGYHEKEAIGESFSKLFTQSDQNKKIPNQLLKTAFEEGTATFEGWQVTKAGSPIFVRLVVSKVNDYADNFDGYSLVSRNKTEEKLLNDIRDTTKQMAKVGGWQVDLVNNTIFWSKMTRIIHEVPPGYTPDLASGINFYLEGEDRETINRLFSNAAENGVEFETELRIKTYKGNIRWVRAKGVPQFLDGKCVKVFGSFQDIDIEKRAQIKLEESEEQFRKTFEYSANGMAIIGPDGKWLEVNKGICDIVGYTKEELLKLTFQDITHPDDLENDLSHLQNLIADKIESYQMEKRYYHKKGHIVWILLAVSKLTDEHGNVKHFISQITDITKRKKAEEELTKTAEVLRKRNEDLEQFAHITSHDLQEPLRTISSFTQLFEQQFADKVDEKGKKYIDFITSATTRLQNLVKGLMEYSRLGNSQKKKEEVKLEEIVEHVTDNLKTLIEETETKITTQNLPTLKAFPIELSLLFQNLINNAIKFRGAETKPCINISGEDIDTHWKVSVSDNGIGIKEEHQKKIFDIFKRLHGQSEYAGSGIGLAHCRKVVDLHQGEIWVESEFNKGSTFYCTFKK